MINRVLAASLACAVFAGMGCSDDGDSTSPPTTTSSSSGGAGGGEILPGTTSCTVRNSEPFVSSMNGTTPYVAANNGDFAVTWLNTDGTELFIAVVDSNGKTISQRSVAKSIGMTQPTLYPEGDGYILLWSQNNTLLGQHIDDKGQQTRQAFSIQDNTVEPHLRGAPSALGMLAAWDAPSGGTLGRFASDGTLNKSVSLSGSPAFPVVASDGASAGVFWSDGGNLAFAPVSSTLELGKVTTISAKATNKGAVGYQGKFYVAWEDVTSGEGSETIKLAQGGQTNAVSVPAESGSANWPGIAQGDGLLAVTYYQFRDGPPSIYLSIFSPDLERQGQDLKVSPDGESDRFPSIAFAQGRFAVAYAKKAGPVKMSFVECQ